MIVFGDHKRTRDAGLLKEAVGTAARRLGALESGLERHSALMSLFIAMAELAQGLADAEFGTGGIDRNSANQQLSSRILVTLAREVLASWRAGFLRQGHLDLTLPAMLARLRCHGEVTTGDAEGYAHYALYPETYLAAAARSGLGTNTCVVGIRSIGLGLAAMVAAALDAPPPLSLRPAGHPFRRRIMAGPGLVAGQVKDTGVNFAVVDEGPGLSGSSFLSVVRWLLGQGVALERIHLFPSHSGGPGGEASAESLDLWRRCRTHVATFEATFDGATAPSLGDWVRETLAVDTVELNEVSVGQWRGRLSRPVARWPPIVAGFERRKFLASSGAECFLVKFAGLGDIGTRKLRTARALHRAGFSTETLGLCHGFLVERWVDGARLDDAAPQKHVLVEQVARYLGWRCVHLPAQEAGASLADLARMAVQNCQEALGPGHAADLRRWLETNRPPQPTARVEIDGRLHAWEFLRRSDGTLLKTDALDHCRSHEFIGCQPIEWDIAGARVEHDLCAREYGRFVDRVAFFAGRAIDLELSTYMLPCYLAAQLGLWMMARAACEMAKERPRLGNMVLRYQSGLLRFLDAEGAAA